LSFIVRIEIKSWAKDKDLLSKLAYKHEFDLQLARSNPDSTYISASPLQTLPNVMSLSNTVYLSPTHFGNAVTPKSPKLSELKHAHSSIGSSKSFLAQGMTYTSSDLTLPGTYQTPLFVRTKYEFSQEVIEHRSTIIWKISHPEIVTLFLSVLNTDKLEKSANLSLCVISNALDSMELALNILDSVDPIKVRSENAKDVNVVFENDFFVLGKFAPGQAKNVFLHTNLFNERIDEDIRFEITDLTSGSKSEFNVRLHIDLNDK